MPQLQLNSGPQDALLYDNTRSYFTNVGYVRTSNFQLELRDVDSQNTANLGSTVQFVIPKAADLLGPVDLMLELAPSTNANSTSGTTTANQFAAWVDAVGFAMIEKIVFSVGSHDIETITGDQLNIMNELMKSDSQRLGTETILKTGQPAYYSQVTDATTASILTNTTSKGRLLSAGTANVAGKKKLIVPLGLFFTKHPSQYFPLCSIAGCNDVRISVKLRSTSELVQLGITNYDIVDSVLNGDNANDVSVSAPTFADGPIVSGSCKLRCHYVHVTGPEATTLMNKEHVRLLKLWQVNTKTFSLTKGQPGDKQSIASMDLSFLHPVSELIITIRKVSEMGSSTSTAITPQASNQGAITKNYFAYHGGGKDPNPDACSNKFLKSTGAAGAVDGDVEDAYLTVDNIQLTLNGQERHPSLAAKGLDRNYLMNRLMPMLHSNSSSVFSSAAESTVADGSEADFAAIGEMLDRKEIYVYPFSLNPEGSNPSGAVNFSKVSHAKLAIEGIVSAVASTAVEYQVDVYGVHYNWLQIKDGRALTSFS
jgi:hypothetical protein